MKATLDLPDDLYRRVKSRSALEGRPVRSVAIELFEKWLSPQDLEQAHSDQFQEETLKYPWLAISTKYPNKNLSHDMSDISESIAKGWSGLGR